ncbi:hypothetical protein [Legionella birminghamensis]|nr:hypothetical protein [Legionella birminghamensis]
MDKFSANNTSVPNALYEDYSAVSEYLLTSYFNLYKESDFDIVEYEHIWQLISSITGVMLKASERFPEADILKIITLSAEFCEKTSGKASESCLEAEEVSEKIPLLDIALKWVDRSISLFDEQGIKVGFSAFLLKLEILRDRFNLSEDKQNFLDMLELIKERNLLKTHGVTPAQRLYFFALSLQAAKHFPEARLSTAIVKAALNFSTSSSFPILTGNDEELEYLKYWLDIFQNQLAENLGESTIEPAEFFSRSVTPEGEEAIHLAIEPRQFLSNIALEKMPVDLDDTDDSSINISTNSESSSSSEIIEEVVVIFDDEEALPLLLETGQGNKGRKKREASQVVGEDIILTKTSTKKQKREEVEIIEVCLETPDTVVIEEEVILIEENNGLLQQEQDIPSATAAQRPAMQQPAYFSSSAQVIFFRRSPNSLPASAPGIENKTYNIPAIGHALIKVLEDFIAERSREKFKPIILSFIANFMESPRHGNQPAVSLFLYRQANVLHPQNNKLLKGMFNLVKEHPELINEEQNYACVANEKIYSNTLIMLHSKLGRLFEDKAEEYKILVEKLLQYLERKLQAWKSEFPPSVLKQAFIEKFNEEINKAATSSYAIIGMSQAGN